MNTVVRWILMAVAGVAVVGAGIGVAIHRAGASTPAPVDSNAAILDALKAIAAKIDARPVKEVLPTGTPFRPYADAYNRAVTGNRPLCIWVAYKCPSSAHQLTDMEHTCVDAYGGDATQRVIVAITDGNGGLRKIGTVRAPDCCATNIRAALVPQPVQGASVGGTHGNGFVGVGLTVDHNCPT